MDTNEAIQKRNLEAQQSVIAGLEHGRPSKIGSNDDDDEIQQQQQQHRVFFDPINPAEFSRESVMFVRYAVDCTGVPIFDLPPEEVQKLWLDFCVEFNSGSALSSEWYQAAAAAGEGILSSGQQQQQRVIRLDATTWPSLDKTTSHKWNLQVDDATKTKMEDAARTSTKLAQAQWRSFFVTGKAAYQG